MGAIKAKSLMLGNVFKLLNRPMALLVQDLLAGQHPSRQAFSYVVLLFVDFACVGVYPSGIKLLSKELRHTAEMSLLRRLQFVL